MLAMGALGVLLLLVVLLLILQGLPGSGLVDATAGSANSRLNTLLAAQAAILDARKALIDESDEAFNALEDAADQLRSAEQNGLLGGQAKAMNDLIASIETIQNGREMQQTLIAAANQMEVLLPELETRANALAEANTVQSQTVVTAQLQRLSLLAESLRRDIRSLAIGFGDSAELTLQLLEADMALAQITNGFKSGDPELGLRAVTDIGTQDALGAMAETYANISENINSVLEWSDQLGEIDQARRQLDALAVELAPNQAMTSGAVAGPGGDAGINLLAGLLGTAMLIILFMSWTFYQTSDTRKAVERQAEQTGRNQAAIIQLLDELGSLADGDLTVQATVTEDITGAIADSINYAIEALRELVITLNKSAIMVDGAAKQTDATAQQLAEASAAQSMQIQAASQAIVSMTGSSEEISGNAERSSDVARHSVDVAHKGGDAVRRMIKGMNTIRETIQETAKRIKRLGESSQEIGDIIELINDIADQTNILALNASIQASMAGEAGRGFAVIADEVQRLAERSANATKQIEVLVRTIQADTNEAMVSMERSTTDVVGGALLAENAGAALEEIEQVSNQIASLVQNISGSAREQVNSAAKVTRNMGMLQEINKQTATGTSATTESIRKLAGLAAQLRESVAGFRLPDTESNATAQDRQDKGGDGKPVIKRPVVLDSDKVKFADQKTA